MKYRINGTTLACDQLGESGPPLVLIHGFGLNRSIWSEMASAYLPAARVILPDVRGHGESDAPAGVYSMDLLAADLAGLLDQLDVEKTVVCGHSMGGYISLAFAARYPNRLAGLGLIASRADADSPEKRAGRYRLAEDVLERGAGVLADSLAPRLSRDPAVVKLAREQIMQTKPRGIIGAALGMAERPDRTAFLTGLDLPTLIAAGEEDQIVPFADAQKMAEGLRQGTFRGLPAAGHMPMVEQPEALGRVLSAFVQQVAEAGGV